MHKGELVVAAGAVLDYETTAQQVIDIQISDAEDNTFSHTVNVAIENVNEAATQIWVDGQATIVIDENTAVDTEVGILSNNDPDHAETSTYKVLNNDNFFVNTQGQLVVAAGASLDFETSSQQSVDIQVTDSAGNVFVQTMPVSINNVNEAVTSVAWQGGGELTISERDDAYDDLGNKISLATIVIQEPDRLNDSPAGQDFSQIQLETNSSNFDVVLRPDVIYNGAGTQYLADLYIRDGMNIATLGGITEALDIKVIDPNDPSNESLWFTQNLDLNVLDEIDPPTAKDVDIVLTQREYQAWEAIRGSNGENYFKNNIYNAYSWSSRPRMTSVNNYLNGAESNDILQRNGNNFSLSQLFNGENLVYELEATNLYGVGTDDRSSQSFKIGGANNDLILVDDADSINFEAKNQYTLTVKAYTEGLPEESVTQTITINIQDVNERQLIADTVIRSPGYSFRGPEWTGNTKINKYTYWIKEIDSEHISADSDKSISNNTTYSQWWIKIPGAYETNHLVLLDEMQAATPDFDFGPYYEGVIEYSGGIGRGLYLNWNVATYDKILTPLVLDIKGDGLYFSSNIQFDNDTDGILESTPWIGAGDALLALDRNGDGVINNGSEISFQLDKLGAATDLEGLAGWDEEARGGNADGILDANDAKFSEFLLWQDANQNGISEAHELQTLAAAGIQSIDLTPVPNIEPVDTAGVNLINTSTFTRTDGTTSTVGDVAFAYSEINPVDSYTEINGDTNNNAIDGDAASNIITGLGGNDFLYGAKGNDVLDGGQGNDTLVGGEGNDLFIGGEGNDVINGQVGVNTVWFGRGHGSDVIEASKAAYTIHLFDLIESDVSRIDTTDGLTLYFDQGDQISIELKDEQTLDEVLLSLRFCEW